MCGGSDSDGCQGCLGHGYIPFDLDDAETGAPDCCSAHCEDAREQAAKAGFGE
jgi:hypothetical protein